MCVLQRGLSEELIRALIDAPFWQRIIEDPELHPTIRDDSVTVYFRGAALLRNLHLEGNRLTGDIHYKYVPVRRPAAQPYLSLRLEANRLGFVEEPLPLPLGDGDPGVLAEYKRVMAAINESSESEVVHRLCGWSNAEGTRRNVIVDQEIAFQLPNEPNIDRIDLLHYDSVQGCFVFVEVKGIDDARLVAQPGEVPEVVEQMARYRARIDRHRQNIRDVSNGMVTLKRRIGLADRFDDIRDGMLDVLPKAVLVIGDCSQQDVDAIMNGEGRWGALIDGLEEQAAGLILCGKMGGNLDLGEHGQCQGFRPNDEE